MTADDDPTMVECVLVWSAIVAFIVGSWAAIIWAVLKVAR